MRRPIHSYTPIAWPLTCVEAHRLHPLSINQSHGSINRLNEIIFSFDLSVQSAFMTEHISVAVALKFEVVQFVGGEGIT